MDMNYKNNSWTKQFGETVRIITWMFALFCLINDHIDACQFITLEEISIQ